MKFFIMALIFTLLLGTVAAIPSFAAGEAYDYEQGRVIVKTMPAVWLIHFQPTDITGATAIQFDFFIDNAADFRMSAIEFGSHYRNDWQEIQFTGATKWPTLQDGWNTVTFQLSAGDPVSAVDPKDGTTGKFDPKTFQRIRIFNTTGTDPQITIALRNVVAVLADGTEIPVGSEYSGEQVETPKDPPIFDLTVQPGSDETALNFNWIAGEQPDEPFVEIALASEDFETHKEVFKGTFVRAGSTGISGNDILFRYACKVTASGLKPDRSYHYRVGYGSYRSDIHTVTTQHSKVTTAYVLSDIHVIDHPSWTDKLPVSVENWEITLGQLRELAETDMILSLGDQMQDTTSLDYLDGFFGVDGLADSVIAPINGNHDISPASKNLDKYTNVPNAVYPGSKGISDYYFKSGKTLFIMLSITDINYDEVDHEKTFREAIAAYPDYDWMVVCFHEAIYGNYLNGYKADSGDPLDYCNDYYETFIDLFDKYKPDLCLTGHSHIYGRSYFIRYGGIVDVEQNEDGAFISPSGTVYVNMGTSSRMWQFGNTTANPNWPFSYMAFTCTDNAKAAYTYGILNIAGGTLSLEVYDNLEPTKLIDTLTIVKEVKADTPVETETDAQPIESESEQVPTDGSETDKDMTAETDKEPDQKGKGCAGTIGLGTALGMGATVAGCACAVKKKKQDD